MLQYLLTYVVPNVIEYLVGYFTKAIGYSLWTFLGGLRH
jgi:hypothetical protein